MELWDIGGMYVDDQGVMVRDEWCEGGKRAGKGVKRKRGGRREGWGLDAHPPLPQQCAHTHTHTYYAHICKKEHTHTHSMTIYTCTHAHTERQMHERHRHI